MPGAYYLAIICFAALIAATVLAAPLAREIDGHLEITLTKPISRVRYALEAFGADVVGVFAVAIMATVAFYCCQLLFGSYRIDFSQLSAQRVTMALLLPLAWYAMLAAATTWFPRSYGVLLGFSWPIAGMIGFLAIAHFGTENVVLTFIHDTAWVISRAIPLTYANFESGTDAQAVAGLPNYATRVLTEALLFVVYGGLAMWRWLRVEA
jgi:hypothetical protein